jgi:hypothetical protein
MAQRMPLKPQVSGAPTANLFAQWKADANVYSDAGTTLATNGQTVQQWNDQTANALHFTQATSGARPTFNTNQQNSLPGITFDGSNDTFIKTLSIGTKGTIFVVYKLVVWANFAMMWEMGPSGSSFEDYGIQCRSSNGELDRMDSGGFTPYQGGATGTPTIGCMVIPSSGTGTLRQNASSSPVSVTINGSALDGINLASRGSFGFCNVQYFEILIYNTNLDSTTETAARNYLNAKWAIF